MSASLVFSFDPDVSAKEAVLEVAAFFEIAVAFDGQALTVPPHIKRAVENAAAIIAERDNPAAGVEVNPAIVFGALVNGAALPNVSAPSSAVVETSATAQTANADISATLPAALSAPALPAASAVAVQPGNVATGNPVIIDKDGLPHDVRIHSKDPTLTDKGFWRKKRGVTDDTVRTVEAQLRAIGSLPGPSTDLTVPHVPDILIDRKAEAVRYAHDEAVRVCGSQPMDDSTLAMMLAGKSCTISIEQSDWYQAYFSKRNSAYGEFISRPLTVAPVAPIVVPEAPISAPHLALDATGLPHDARIHIPAINGNVLKDAAGVYLQRMDVSPETKLAIMAELRGNAAGTASITQASDVGTTPVAPTVPSVPQVSAADAGTSFPLMMRWLVQNQIGGKLTLSQVSDVAKSFGFADAEGNGAVALMASRVDYFPAFVQTLIAYGAV